MEQVATSSTQEHDYFKEIYVQVDKLVRFALIGLFVIGLLLAFWYDTWMVAGAVGGLTLAAYFLSKQLLPKSHLYQYVGSACFAVFMAQFIYQMHGMFEMHFFAFLGPIVMIGYQNWKLQLPVLLAVVVHHATFAYLQYSGMKDVYFTQLDYMDLETFIIHAIIAAIIVAVCGYWAYTLNQKSNEAAKASCQIQHQLERIEINKHFAEEISKGNLDIAFEGDDTENDPLSMALFKMRESLKDTAEKEQSERFVNLGITKLGEIFQNNANNSEALYDETVGYLVNYMNMVQGALFIVEESNEGKLLRQVATYAYDRHKFQTTTIKPGEGLVGQCLMERKPVYLKKVPENYLKVVSGLGEAPPRSILIFPLISNDEVLGVIEVASLNEIPDTHRRFLEKSSENLAATLKTTKTGEETKKLLKVSRKQQDEMQQQEEEMRQNMEEMQAIQEEMNNKIDQYETQISTQKQTISQLESQLPGK